MTKMAGVPQTKPGFAKNRVFATLMNLGISGESLAGILNERYLNQSFPGVKKGGEEGKRGRG